jgi:hypothetical protein
MYREYKLCYDVVLFKDFFRVMMVSFSNQFKGQEKVNENLSFTVKFFDRIVVMKFFLR